MKEYVGYSKQDVLANTDLERARSLSDQEPSLTGLAVALVGAGLAGGAAAKVFGQARNLRKLAISGDKGAMFELRQIADKYHVDLTDVVPEPKPATTPVPNTAPHTAPHTAADPHPSPQHLQAEERGGHRQDSGRHSPTDKGTGSRPLYAKDPKPPGKPRAKPATPTATRSPFRDRIPGISRSGRSSTTRPRRNSGGDSVGRSTTSRPTTPGGTTS